MASTVLDDPTRALRVKSGSGPAMEESEMMKGLRVRVEKNIIKVTLASCWVPRITSKKWTGYRHEAMPPQTITSSLCGEQV
ncbi:hypothetical protein TNCV_2172231 [Trichonephila clavipes]|nr:hypothetical protein TNCV_2172231 [Trichonephila clavipes]